MAAATVPHYEAARLEELHRYGILDTDADPSFDRITDLAGALFSVPIALVSLVDENRQWFKSCIGLREREPGRDVAFCAHAILSDDPLVIADARDDERFRDNPLVTGPPHIRFYAGAPLVTPSGQRIGTMCIIDSAPRSFDDAQRRRLQSLALTVVDLLELHSRTRDLELARTEMVTVLESMDDLVVARDLERRPLFINRAAREAFGSASDLRDAAGWLRGSKMLRADLTEPIPDELPILRALAGETVRDAIYCLPKPDASAMFISINATPLLNTKGRIVGGVTVGRDVTEFRRLQELERQSARTDPLTNLGNRRALEDVAPSLLAGADRRGAKPAAVALFDLDHFKRINDTAGHGVGDEVLRVVAGVLRAQVRATDLPVRWGGEELLVLLPDCDENGARGFAERVRIAVEQLDIPEAGTVTLSSGVTARAHGEDLQKAIARADAKLYEAKRAGRNCVR